MRDLFQDATASLFDAPPSATYLHAKEFVRWCCSFGPNFRNSPDVINLRYWAKKEKVKVKEQDEPEILEIALPMFLKRIEQAVRKAEKIAKAETPN
jgi:hypothetical protein